MKIKKLLTAILISFSLIFNPAKAAERFPEGHVLTEESYVFTLEEAQELRQQILTLENEVDKFEELAFEYENLSQVYNQKTETWEELIEIKDLQLAEFYKIQQINLNRIERLEKIRRWDKVEKWAFLGVGIGLTIGAVLIADKIDDRVEGSGQPTKSNGMTLLRF